MERDDLVVVMTFNRVNNAEMHQALLASAGVQSYLLDENMGVALPVGGMLQVRLAVASKDEKRAREVLSADFDHEEFKKGSGVKK